MGLAHFVLPCELAADITSMAELTSQGMVNQIGGSTIAAFDSSGVVFAVACSQTQTVMLYDSTSLDDVSWYATAGS